MTVLLSATEPSPIFDTVHTIKLPEFSEGVPLAPGDVTQNGVTLSIDDNATFDFDTLLFGDAAEQVFRAETVVVADFNFPAVDTSLNMEMLVALGPQSTVVCPAAKLTVPNVMGWAANSAVGIYLHGNLTFKHYAPYGQWERIASGIVSADGASVSTTDGIELLGLYGVALE